MTYPSVLWSLQMQTGMTISLGPSPPVSAPVSVFCLISWHFRSAPSSPSGVNSFGSPTSWVLPSFSFAASARMFAKMASRVFSGSSIWPYAPPNCRSLAPSGLASFLTSHEAETRCGFFMPNFSASLTKSSSSLWEPL